MSAANDPYLVVEIKPGDTDRSSALLRIEPLPRDEKQREAEIRRREEEKRQASVTLAGLARRHDCPGADECRDILGHADDVMALRQAMEACGLLPYAHQPQTNFIPHGPVRTAYRRP